MLWETSPAAAELEEAMMNWLKRMTGIPETCEGVIQDTASTATLTALLTAREKASSFTINERGFDTRKYRIYGSTETHSSIEKAVKIAGFGKENLVQVPVDEEFRMDPVALEKAINEDLENGETPLFITVTLGTTGSTAIDSLEKIAPIAGKYNLWLHVDAALAGTALLLEEYKWMIKGIEQVDSFVFNPHKWMFTNFDCSAYFVKDRDALLRTFSIHPEYLKTRTSGQVNDYRDWGIPLGRRFRALKLWFVIRSYGLEGLKKKIREHISIAAELEQWIRNTPNFEVVTARTLNLVCFRYKPNGIDNQTELSQLNEKLLQALNATGKMYLSHTKLNGIYTLRMVTSQTYVTLSHVKQAWQTIQQTAKKIR
jgi:aromatic-L-amino-acid decarboxylase